MSRLLLINPNANVTVTQEIATAMDPLRGHPDVVIDVEGLPDGPPGIQSQLHIEQVVPLLLNRIQHSPADAYVIACFSDPGLFAARELAAAPVFGIAECGILTALTRGTRFGIVSILPNSIARHIRYVNSMGLHARMAGDRAIGIGVAGLADEAQTWNRVLETGRQLRDTDGADVLILGCAGMARYRGRLAEALRIPVVEPSQAAAGMALTAMGLGW